MDVLSTALPATTSAPAPVQAEQVHVPHHRTFGHVAFEVFGIWLAFTLVSWLTYECFYGINKAHEADRNAGNTLAIIYVGAIFAGYLLADFGSGVVHFTFDRFFSLKTPLLGENFVSPFRLHHSDPKHITTHGFIETNGNNCLAACCALIPLCIIPFDYTVGWQLFVVALFVFASIGTFATNQFHKWAHLQHPPKWVAWLQEKHLILPRDHHQLHHTHPYNIHYCITTGWMNSILLKVNFWAFLEFFGQKILRMALYTEETPWERIPGSPAFAERQEMATLAHQTK